MPTKRFNKIIIASLLTLPISAQQQEGVSSITRPEEEAIRPVILSRPGQSRERLPIIGAAPSSVPTAPAPAVASARPPTAAPVTIQPTWETQKLARSYTFLIPAPRGQITDRNGVPLAQNRMAQNLAIVFPLDSKYSDAEAQNYINARLAVASRLCGRPIVLEGDRMDKAVKHYKNRSMMPLVVALDLKPNEVTAVQQSNAPGLMLQAIYQRIYPQGKTAGHMVGYVGRMGNALTGVIESGESLWPQVEGREGLELVFNEQLTGKNGTMFISYDAQGRKSEERILVPPTPGQNVVTAIDLKIQRAVEGSLASAGRPCAMTVMDCTNGEVLAMASYPNYDPNVFVPTISQDEMDALSNPKGNHPLIPRAYRASYPLGSVFKVFTGFAALSAGKIDPDDQFGGKAKMKIDGRWFANHTSRESGPKNFVQAMTVSDNTYFYTTGLKTGFPILADYSRKLGFGSKTGVTINNEESGGLNDIETIRKTEKREGGQGDLANMAIGQGKTEVTTLQVAKAMSAMANGGTVYQPRLVLQVQGVDDKVTMGYDLRVRHQFSIDKEVASVMKKALLSVVYGGGGTGRHAQVSGLKIAGKTGTAQWGAGKDEKVAAWFSGYAPAEKPKWAFATVYEGKKGDDSIHGGTHSGPIIARALSKFPKPWPEEEKEGGLRKSKKKKKKLSDDDDKHEADAPDNDPPPKPKVRRRESEEVVQ